MPVPKSVPKILIVDDDIYALQTIHSIVKGLGYIVHDVTSGKAALEILKKEKFDLVLLDVLMPQMGGREVLIEIRKTLKLKKLKVILLSVVELGDLGFQLIKNLQPVSHLDKASGITELRKHLKLVLNS